MWVHRYVVDVKNTFMAFLLWDTIKINAYRASHN